MPVTIMPVLLRRVLGVSGLASTGVCSPVGVSKLLVENSLDVASTRGSHSPRSVQRSPAEQGGLQAVTQRASMQT
jgi:hypothetical protein